MKKNSCCQSQHHFKPYKVSTSTNYIQTFSYMENPLFFSLFTCCYTGRVAQLVGHMTRKSGILGSIPGLAT